VLLYTDRPLACPQSSSLSNEQLMVNTGTKVSNADLAHTTSTKAGKQPVKTAGIAIMWFTIALYTVVLYTKLKQ